jgi:hypothetical protein
MLDVPPPWLRDYDSRWTPAWFRLETMTADESNSQTQSIRTELSSENRATLLDLSVDPGFVHHRKIQALIGREGMRVIDQMINELPDLPDFQRRLRIDYIYRDVLLEWCRQSRTGTLEDSLSSEAAEGVFCSIELLEPQKKLNNSNRVVSVWKPRHPYALPVEFEYDPALISGSTLALRLENGDDSFALVAHFKRGQRSIRCEPFLIGFPLLVLENGSHAGGWAPFFAREFYEHFVEDFEEFSKVREIPVPDSPQPMQEISEAAFKLCVSKILGGSVQSDWGGEASDFYTSHIHLGDRRTTAAFLFKGPARFQPMGLNHLGKNNDQLVRLCHEPANVFVVQHCHDILPPVRETLRALAVQPGNARRYCLMDGRDSIRLLMAYDLYETAKDLSKKKS